MTTVHTGWMPARLLSARRINLSGRHHLWRSGARSRTGLPRGCSDEAVELLESNQITAQVQDHREQGTGSPSGDAERSAMRLSKSYF